MENLNSQNKWLTGKKLDRNQKQKYDIEDFTNKRVDISDLNKEVEVSYDVSDA